MLLVSDRQAPACISSKSAAHARITAPTWAMFRNVVSFRRSSRARPLKPSTKSFCIGLPGAM